MPPLDLEDQLSSNTTVAEIEDPRWPMIMMNGQHNRNIIVDYQVVVEQHVNAVEPELDERELVDDATSQDYLRHVLHYKDQFKRNLWGKLIPKVLGFELAAAEVIAEQREIFGDTQIELRPYQRALSDIAFAACAREVAQMFEVPLSVAEIVLRSKLDEQGNRSRSNARADSPRRTP